jgi:hypothetical protein
MKKTLFLFLFVSATIPFNRIFAQVKNETKPVLDVSLFWKKSGKQEAKISNDKGSLFLKLGHHGPAIENLWVAYRVYFNDAGGVDVYSKFEARLELKATKWYASKAQKEGNFGSDNFAVGKTVGLGGIKLWDGENFNALGPVSNRTAEVELNDTMAQIRMTSLGVPYQGKRIDIVYSISCFSNMRHALIEVRVLNNIAVQFATGIPSNSDLIFEKMPHAIMAWGDYKSHERHAVFNLGTALVYDSNDFEDSRINGDEYLLISKPTSFLSYAVTSANDKENSALNSFEAFKAYVIELENKLLP